MRMVCGNLFPVTSSAGAKNVDPPRNIATFACNYLIWLAGQKDCCLFIMFYTTSAYLLMPKIQTSEKDVLCMHRLSTCFLSSYRRKISLFKSILLFFVIKTTSWTRSCLVNGLNFKVYLCQSTYTLLLFYDARLSSGQLW